MQKTVTFVDFWRILDYIGFEDTERDAIYDYGFDGVTWGDSAYTLVGNKWALECLINGVTAYRENYATVTTHTPSLDEIRTKYWECVAQDDWVNMEG